MVNKREGYKRVANVVSYTLAVLASVFCIAGILYDLDSWIELGIKTIIIVTVLYKIPQYIYKAGCYIADGFKGQP